MPRVARPSRLSVGSPLIRKRLREPRGASLAARAPSLPRSSPTTNTRPTRDSPSRRSRSAADTWAARMPFASQEPRPYSRSPSTRLGKNGGTQSKCVEKTRPAGSRGCAEPQTFAMTLKRVSSTRCSITDQPAPAQVVGQPASCRAFASGGRVDVDEAARQSDNVYRIHASSSVRVSVRESRYFTMTGVASDRPHSTPLPTVTARAPGTTTAPSGTTSGRSAVGLMISPLDQIVDGRRAGEHRAGRDDRPRLDDRALVDAGVSADQHLVLDDDRQRADRLDDAADLRARR